MRGRSDLEPQFHAPLPRPTPSNRSSLLEFWKWNALEFTVRRECFAVNCGKLVKWSMVWVTKASLRRRRQLSCVWRTK